MWPYPIKWLNVPTISYKMCIRGASHELKWIPIELPCPLSNEMCKIEIIFMQTWGALNILSNEMYKIEINFFRPEETQMSSDEFRVTQHVMKTIKDEMPAIVRSMVSMFWFFHCTVSAFELRVFLWYSLIRLIIHDYTVITRSNLPQYRTRWRLPWLWPVSPLLRPGAYIFHKLVSTVCNF